MGDMNEQPTYTVHEVIELMREADDIQTMLIVEKQIIEEKYRYSLYDLHIMIEAGLFICRELARRDAANDLKLFKSLLDL